MASTILSGTKETKTEPRRSQHYEVLSCPSKVSLDFVPGTYFETNVSGIREINVLTKVTELNKIRLPMEANPRKPEQLPVVDDIQAAATEPAPNYFVFKNNGIDVFCKVVSRGDPPQADTLTIEFGPESDKDGICNGAVTYYSLQRLNALPSDPEVKIRFYQLPNATPALKSAIAQAKNRNRAVSGSDDANFMGYFDRLKQQLGAHQNLIKWGTGDVEIAGATTNPLSVIELIRYLSALKIEDAYHWDQNPTEDLLRSHKSRESLLKNPAVHTTRFIEEMEP
jgi:hypothetical protein